MAPLRLLFAMLVVWTHSAYAQSGFSTPEHVLAQLVAKMAITNPKDFLQVQDPTGRPVEAHVVTDESGSKSLVVFCHVDAFTTTAEGMQVTDVAVMLTDTGIKGTAQSMRVKVVAGYNRADVHQLLRTKNEIYHGALRVLSRLTVSGVSL